MKKDLNQCHINCVHELDDSSVGKPFLPDWSINSIYSYSKSQVIFGGMWQADLNQGGHVKDRE